MKTLAYTYILKCSDGSYYTGWTTDINKRLKAHNLGTASKYTKSRRPVELVYFETFDSDRDARKRECAIKKLSRQEKAALIEGGSVFGIINN